MVWRLQDDTPTLFPDPHYGDEDGLIAVGGDLSPERLVTAYSNGIFPWYGFKENEDIMWWCPLDRFVIFPKEIHISHSMRQLINKGKYTVTINEAFDQVIEQCSKSSQRDKERGAWLGPDMIRAYKEMHDLGLACSIEVWEEESLELREESLELREERLELREESLELREERLELRGERLELRGERLELREERLELREESLEMREESLEMREERRKLVGGLYGINIGYNFFGESMFSLVPSASKLALIFLAEQLEPFGGIIDCQFETPHLKSMGGRHITYDEYMTYLSQK